MTIEKISEEILKDHGQSIKEIVYYMWLDNTSKNVYLNVASSLEQSRRTDLALRFLEEAFDQCFNPYNEKA